jgi:hypothetical protein
LEFLNLLGCYLHFRWWNDLNFAEEFPYARDRIVEIYFWANGVHFEPQYAFSRMMVTKYMKIVSLVDDTYDAYASFEEIQHFTNAIERFVSCYLIVCLSLLNLS